MITLAEIIINHKTLNPPLNTVIFTILSVLNNYED